MSIRLIAKDLYRYQQTVNRLEEKLARAPIGDRDRLKRELDRARSERDQIKRMLDGHLNR